MNAVLSFFRSRSSAGADMIASIFSIADDEGSEPVISFTGLFGRGWICRRSARCDW